MFSCVVSGIGCLNRWFSRLVIVCGLLLIWLMCSSICGYRLFLCKVVIWVSVCVSYLLVLVSEVIVSGVVVL